MQLRRRVRGCGVKGLDAGVGCGVGIGYGYGAGLFLKPDALAALTRSLQHVQRASILAEACFVKRKAPIAMPRQV